MTPSALPEASNFLNARLRGRTLAEARRRDARRAGRRAPASWTPPRRGLVEEGIAAWSGGEGVARALIVRGRANLLGDPDALADLERVRMLFDDLEQKEQLIGLLD